MAKKEKQQEKIRATVVLEGIDDAILSQVEKDQGVSRSAAVRMIIRQFGRVEESAQTRQPC
jgi:hypothetical protein